MAWLLIWWWGARNSLQISSVIKSIAEAFTNHDYQVLLRQISFCENFWNIACIQTMWWHYCNFRKTSPVHQQHLKGNFKTFISICTQGPSMVRGQWRTVSTPFITLNSYRVMSFLYVCICLLVSCSLYDYPVLYYIINFYVDGNRSATEHYLQAAHK
jgi:hypothetical protein